MGKKRKAEATRLDEVDRTLYSAFCSAANSISQISTQAMAHQKLAFQAGERHALEKLYQLILGNNEESRVNVADIVAYLQREIDYGDDGSESPSDQLAHQHLPSNMHQPNAAIQNPPCVIGSVAIGHVHRTSQSEQSKDSIFTNALSNPIGSSPFQLYHQAHSGGCHEDNALRQTNEDGNHDRNFVEKNQESNSLSINDSSMDMHSDSPPHAAY